MTNQFLARLKVVGARSAGILIALAALGLAQSAHAQYASQSTATSVPPGFTACATDSKVCKVPAGATVTIYYGANTSYAVLKGKGDFTCLPANLGIADPAMKVAKTCYISSTGGTAPAPAPAPATAGPGTVTAVPAGAVACATDGGKCAATGAWTGVYGAKQTFAPISGIGPFTCLPNTFSINDPAPGVQKTCYIKGTIAAAPAPAPAPAPPAPACTAPTDSTGHLAAVTPTNTNCNWMSAKTLRGMKCVAAINCSCACAANMGTACKFNGASIASPVCLPGQSP